MCGSCRWSIHVSAGANALGTGQLQCHLNPPQLFVLPLQGTASPLAVRGGPQAVNIELKTWAIFPPVADDMPGCAHHPENLRRLAINPTEQDECDEDTPIHDEDDGDTNLS